MLSLNLSCEGWNFKYVPLFLGPNLTMLRIFPRPTCSEESVTSFFANIPQISPQLSLLMLRGTVRWSASLSHALGSLRCLESLCVDVSQDSMIGYLLLGLCHLPSLRDLTVFYLCDDPRTLEGNGRK
ncbi:uncharacterized protein LAESUDRAFT_224652 [Laetiporus sulphureus 93-53]|uniref:F-box domain-containing protein n=1 Tax=Laetiporus sulphureus 93-53 TaxID=1314785 RepID=A0A165DPF9_9APHY|nr:uncharacterized protein LAESUDRAFT_224652 [Laetiporus sulphureus 93-53]KZT05330.1 hypothetical protein LAESUDRAFT_224652 [Laetiporus sulphureus 93-53]